MERDQKYQGFFHLNLMSILGGVIGVSFNQHVPVLLLLGNDAGADVLPDRTVGA
ncbi:hypothetical protein ACLB1Q_32620 [Escherichia coli]